MAVVDMEAYLTCNLVDLKLGPHYPYVRAVRTGNENRALGLLFRLQPTGGGICLGFMTS
jgi:hypothetical protein